MKRVVVTGIGAVSPYGIGRKVYQTALLEGQSGITRISSFDPAPLDSQIAGSVTLNGYAFPKKDERNLPRVVQLALLASEEATRDAKFDLDKMGPELQRRFGVILGTGGGSIEFMEKHYGMYYGKKQSKPSLYVIPASTAGGISSEISIRFGLFAMSHVITTGCTSSTDAIGYAFREIQSGRLSCALTGGADAPIAEGIIHGFCLMKVLSTKWNDQPEKASRPFSRDRDGFVLGEGAWMFVLEEKEHAEKRGATIYAEILGYGSSCEAFHQVRLDETGNGNLYGLKLAMEDANLSPDAIDYVNLHGTSTVLNDRVETHILKRFFGKRAYRIPMSATKSMIGHPQGASGAAGIAATLFMMRENKIHPTINLETEDPECDLDYVRCHAREKEIKHALCNTLGFGSKSSYLVIKNLNT